MVSAKSMGTYIWHHIDFKWPEKLKFAPVEADFLYQSQSWFWCVSTELVM